MKTLEQDNYKNNSFINKEKDNVKNEDQPENINLIKNFESINKKKVKLGDYKKIKGLLDSIINESILKNNPKSYNFRRLFQSKGKNIPKKLEILFFNKFCFKKKKIYYCKFIFKSVSF